MKKKVYLESSFISQIVGRLSSDASKLNMQRISRDWWDIQKENYDLFVSQFVCDEVEAGNPELGKERVSLIESLVRLELNDDVNNLVKTLLKSPIPKKATVDAFHIAISAVNGVDFLLTWNCKHISNPHMRRDIIKACHLAGFECPVICSPLDFIKEDI